MEVEVKQLEIIEQYCLLAKNARGRALAELIQQATSDPGLFAFGELLELPKIKELEGSEHQAAFELLRLFAFGTCAEFAAQGGRLGQLSDAQMTKMKQLTVLTLAQNAKVLSYDLLMRELAIQNVRVLEDLLINDCMYTGILRGKLDQRRRQLEVHLCAGRDLRPGHLDNVIDVLGAWLSTAEGLLSSTQEKIKWADEQSEERSRHRAFLADRMEGVRQELKTESLLGSMQAEGGLFGEGGATAQLEFAQEAERVRPKRRR